MAVVAVVAVVAGDSGTGAEGEQGSVRGQATGQGGGDRADEQGAVSVAEFPADLGGAIGLAGPDLGCAGGECGKAERVFSAVPRMIVIVGRAGRARMRQGGPAGGKSQHTTRWGWQGACVVGAFGPRLDQGVSGGQHRVGGTGRERAEPGGGPRTGRNPTPADWAAAAASLALGPRMGGGGAWAAAVRPRYRGWRGPRTAGRIHRLLATSMDAAGENAAAAAGEAASRKSAGWQ